MDDEKRSNCYSFFCQRKKENNLFVWSSIRFMNHYTTMRTKFNRAIWVMQWNDSTKVALIRKKRKKRWRCVSVCWGKTKHNHRSVKTQYWFPAAVIKYLSHENKMDLTKIVLRRAGFPAFIGHNPDASTPLPYYKIVLGEPGSLILASQIEQSPMLRWFLFYFCFFCSSSSSSNN